MEVFGFSYSIVLLGIMHVNYFNFILTNKFNLSEKYSYNYRDIEFEWVTKLNFNRLKHLLHVYKIILFSNI